MKTGGNAWTGLTLVSPTDTSVLVDLAPGAKVNFRVRATDAAGHTGTWTSGVPFKVVGLQETAAAC